MGRKVLLVAMLLAVAFTVSRCIPFSEEDLSTEDSLWALYERWRSHHTVARDLDEKHRRFNVFKHNVKFIHEFNKKDEPYKLKLNAFADMTNQEFRGFYAGSKIEHHQIRRGEKPEGEFKHGHVDLHKLPSSVDWRTKGAVTPVKDQGQCGKYIYSRSIDRSINFTFCTSDIYGMQILLGTVQGVVGLFRRLLPLKV